MTSPQKPTWTLTLLLSLSSLTPHRYPTSAECQPMTGSDIVKMCEPITHVLNQRSSNSYHFHLRRLSGYSTMQFSTSLTTDPHHPPQLHPPPPLHPHPQPLPLFRFYCVPSHCLLLIIRR